MLMVVVFKGFLRILLIHGHFSPQDQIMNRFAFEMETQFVLCEVGNDFYVLFISR